jgi:hypothetical protein
VVPLISEILGLVPFVSHSVYTKCITVCHTAARCAGAVLAALSKLPACGKSAGWRLRGHMAIKRCEDLP